jgi:hypothetical protein
MINFTGRDIALQYLYFVISQTPTRFGGIVRKLGKVKYNHASVSLDPKLTKMFAFGRLQHNTLLLAWLMPEHLHRFTLRKYKNVDCTIFRIPVSEEQYDKVCNTITTIGNDPQYMYNYLSVLLFPIFRGFEVYKSYSCIEFVMHILNDDLQLPTEKRLCSYTPDDLLKMLSSYVYYSGNLIEYIKNSHPSGESDMKHISAEAEKKYFGPMTWNLFWKSFAAVFIIIGRNLSFKRRA